MKKSYPNNPFIGYLNINSLHNKIVHLREICKKAPIDILCIDETKLDDSYPDHQFKMEGYQFPPFRRDRNSRGGGKMVFVKQGLIAKRLKNLETKQSETICLELKISKKNWCIIFAYRPPKSNKKHFFDEMTQLLSKAVNSYDNIVVAGDLNIDTSINSKDSSNHLDDLNDIFSLTNLVNFTTCFKSTNETSIDLLLTNRPKSFQKTSGYITGLSDCHKLVTTVLKSTYIKIPPKWTYYRNYKQFNEKNFLFDLDQNMVKGEFYKQECDDKYSKFTELFTEVMEKTCTLKKEKN